MAFSIYFFQSTSFVPDTMTVEIPLHWKLLLQHISDKNGRVVHSGEEQPGPVRHRPGGRRSRCEYSCRSGRIHTFNIGYS